MSEITVEVTSSDIVSNITTSNIAAAVTTTDIQADITTQNIECNITSPNIVVNLQGGSISGGGGHSIEDEGTPLPARSALNFVGAGVTATDAGGKTVVTIPGGGGGGFTEITYADMATALAGGTLTAGSFYNITDAAGTDFGFVTHAVQDNEISVAGVGGYLNADFQAVGDYTGVEGITGIPFTQNLGIWRPSFEQYQMITEDGETRITEDSETRVTEFSGTPIATGDVVIWNLLHWQCIDAAVVDGNSPDGNATAYQQLLKTDAGQGYIEEWDLSELDFGNNWLQYRADARGNKYTYTKAIDYNIFENGTTAILLFQWGRDVCNINIIFNALVSIENILGFIRSNNLSAGAYFRDNALASGAYFQDNILASGAYFRDNALATGANFYSNILASGAYFYSNTLATGAYFRYNILATGANFRYNILASNANFYSNILASDDYFYSNTLATDAYFYLNTLASGAYFQDNILATGAYFQDNILENGAQMTGITTGSNCSISRNKIGQGATLGNNTTMGDAAEFTDLDIRANKQVSNKTLDAAVLFSDKIVQLTTDATETYSATVEGNRVQPGFSDIPGTIDITALTTLDCTAAWAQYRGIYNLTSTNATEAIDTIANPPTSFPFTLRPEAGLVLTVTGTAIAGIGTGQIALTTADVVLDGDKGEYLELEIDSTQTFLIEKRRVAGLL